MPESKYTITELIRAGVISPTVKNDIEIRDKLKQLMASGKSKGQAVKHIATLFNKSVQGIYVALRRNHIN